jgi:hypothetical protein
LQLSLTALFSCRLTFCTLDSSFLYLYRIFISFSNLLCSKCDTFQHINSTFRNSVHSFTLQRKETQRPSGIMLYLEWRGYIDEM